MVEMTRIRIFCCAAETLNFSRTAQDLNCSVATVSKHITHLEGRLKVRLFNRSTRRIRLTDEGQHYYQACRRLLDDLDTIETRIRDEQTSAEGRIRISIPIALGSDFTMPLLNEFLRLNPGMQIESTLQDPRDDISVHTFDLALRIGNEQGDCSLVETLLGHLDLVACATPGYLASHPTITSVRDLEEHNCIQWTGSPDWPSWHMRDSQAELRGTLNGTLCTNDGRAALLAALDDQGISVLPLFLARKSLQKGALRRILPHLEFRPIPVYLLFPHRTLLPARTRLLIDHLKSAQRQIEKNAWESRSRTNWV